MNKVLIACLLATFLWSCAATQSKSVELNAVSPDGREKPTPTAEKAMANSDDLFNKMKEKTKTPTPTPNPNAPVSDADYNAVKLVQSKMEKTTLARQPREIAEHILAANNETSEKPFGRSLDKINVRVKDYDLDHDGIAERVMIARLYSDESVPVLYVFKSENGKWSRFIFEMELGTPDSESNQEVEFLEKKDKSGFDLIKIIDEYGDEGKPMKDVLYFQMQNGKYERIECRKIEGAATEKTTPCSE